MSAIFILGGRTRRRARSHTVWSRPPGSPPRHRSRPPASRPDRVTKGGGRRQGGEGLNRYRKKVDKSTMALGEQFEQVLRAAQAGAEWAVAALYRDLQPALLGYLRSQQPGEAEDLASEVWTGVASGLRRFEGDEAAFRGWLYTIARRRLSDFRRKAARRRTDPAPAEAFADLASADDAEREALSVISTQTTLDQLAAALSPEQAEVVVMRLVAGLSVDEVARVVGKRPGAVRALQHRAMVRLAKHISPEAITD